MSTYSERYEEAKVERVQAAMGEEHRELWRWCAREQARQIGCLRGWTQAAIVLERLLNAIDDVHDLDVLIRKAQPDMMAFRESRMTPAERYRF